MQSNTNTEAAAVSKTCDEVTRTEDSDCTEDILPVPSDTSADVHGPDDEIESRLLSEPSQKFVSLRDLDLTKGSNTTEQSQGEIEDNPADNVLDPVRSIIGIALLAEESHGITSHDTLTDVGQLLYTCRLFPEAYVIFNKSCLQLDSQANASKMNQVYCRLDSIRAHLPGLQSEEDTATTTTIKDVKSVLVSMTNGLGRTGISYRESISQMLEDLNGDKNGLPTGIWGWADRLSLPSMCNDSIEWMLRQSDLIWRCAASQQCSDAQEVVSELQSWIVGLEQESSPTWQILRGCLEKLREYGMIGSSLGNIQHPDFVKPEILHGYASVLGCFFARAYLQKIPSENLDPVKPLSHRESLARIVSFKLTVQTYLVLAYWIKDPEVEMGVNHQANPITLLILRIQSMLGTPSKQRARQFLQVHKDTWYIRAKERKGVIRCSESESYVMETARLVARASTHIKGLVKYTYIDPIIGKRNRPFSGSTRSSSSTGMLRKIGKRVRMQSGGAESMFSIDELSDKMSMTALSPNLRFSVVTGMSSNPSWRWSMSDKENLIRRFSLSSSKRSSIASTK